MGDLRPNKQSSPAGGDSQLAVAVLGLLLAVMGTAGLGYAAARLAGLGGSGFALWVRGEAGPRWSTRASVLLALMVALAAVLLFPVVQPWYLLWAIIPLAAWATRPGFRAAVIAVTLIVGIFGPTANGDRFALFQIVLATLASTVIVLALIALTYRWLPWRAVPEAATGRLDEPVGTTPTADSATDAYAESP